MRKTAKNYKRQLKKFLYAKNYCGVVEEVVNTWNADIVGVKWSGEVNEFEIKITLSDLRGEVKSIKRALLGNIYKCIPPQVEFGFTYNRIVVDEKISTTKLEKHYHYLFADKMNPWHHENTPSTSEDFVPTKFYFAVPSYLINNAKDLMIGIPNYGLINADTGEFVKKATRLKRANVQYKDIFSLFTRSCTELSQAENSLNYYRDLYEKGEHVHVKTKRVWKDYKGQERIDWI
jgi:hypothetical protein